MTAALPAEAVETASRLFQQLRLATGASGANDHLKL